MTGHTGLGPGDTTENRACSLTLGSLPGGGVQQRKQAIKIHSATSHKWTAEGCPAQPEGLCRERDNTGAQS